MKSIIKNKNGFTFIELMIVISIIGILSTIALINYFNISVDADETVNKATARNIVSAVNMAESKYQTNLLNAEQINEFIEKLEVTVGGEAGTGWVVRLDPLTIWYNSGQYYP